ncbi:DUF1996 domain-containing protein [Streptomyces sp. NPDC005820]|uniref:DUF1996 domain-containing protein n=1 Tax=Streptomyces sp. NPDC005820 TaxID=3157069 RepID=UPI0033C2ED43
MLQLAVPLTVGVSVVLVVGLSGPGRTASGHAAPAAGQYVDIASVPRAVVPADGPDASTGSFTVDCGRNENGHRNADNVVVSPGVTGESHHTHDYVGNVSTNADSTNQSLAAAGTTCVNGDRSTYYWPVLRRLDRQGSDVHATGGGMDGNFGQILTPSSVLVQFRGNPLSEVVAMPRFLRLVTGDPVATSVNDPSRVHAQWGCSGYPDRFSVKYALCPEGSGPTRTLDFPSCWDGLSTDSPDHRSHVVFPGAGGLCPHATFPVPQLRITLTYALPHGTPYAVDSFPEQKRDPRTEHGMFIDVMTDSQMQRVVSCVNDGRQCRET